MNEPDALDFITNRLQPDSDPPLDWATLGDLLAMARTTDEDDHEPDDDEWTPTYSVQGCYRAIAEGYTIKHAAAAGRFEFTTDGQTFRRNQVLDHLEHQRKLYARKVQTASATLGETC